MEEKGFSKDLDKLMQFPPEGIFSMVISKTETSNSTLMCLSAGTGIGEHTSTKEGAICVLKGKGEFVLSGRKIDMRPGIFIFMPKNAPHSLKASEDLAMLLVLAG